MITIGAEAKKPVVMEDEIKLRDMINITMTVDNRFINEIKAANVYKKFTNYLNDPTKCENEDIK